MLQVDGRTVALDPSAIVVDVAEFERLIKASDPAALDRATALYQGDLLEGMDVDEEPFEEWLRRERARLRELVVDGLARLISHHGKSGTADGAIRAGTRLLALDPFREDMYRTLMRLYARQGRRGDALRLYQQCVTVLQRDLQAEPSDETKQIYRELLPERRPGPWVTTSDRTSRGTRGGGAGPLPPQIVDRVAELAKLNEALTAAWRGRGLIAAIAGEAGVGKTRLVEEFAGGAVRRRGRVLFGRAFDAEQVLPFAPWVDILRAGLRLYDEGGVRSPNLIWRGELAKLVPELGEPGDAPPTRNSLRLFEAVAHVLRDLASRWPLVVILEDLHWADEMSIRMFTFLANRIEAFPLLMVATMRDEDLADAPLLHRFFQATDASAQVRRLKLEPLTRNETGALVRALAGRDIDAPAAVRLAEQVWFLSEGNPFLIVEIMRTPETAEAGNVSSGFTLPQRVREVVAARLERLGDPAQQLITVAATAGREFDFALLQRAAGLDEATAAEGVEQLVRRRVIQPVGERFAFTHHAVRGVVYGQLPPHRRKDLHRRVASAIEELYREDLKLHHLTLAQHFSEAEVWPKALGYLSQAGMQAVERSAHREAVMLFGQALDVLTRLPKSRLAMEQAIDVNLAIEHALLFSGEPAQALVHLREAELLTSAIGDQQRLGWVLAHFGECFRISGEHDRAIGAGRRALAMGVALGDGIVEAELRLQLGQAHLAAGEYREAVALFAPNVDETAASDDAAPDPESLRAALIRHRASSPLLAAASRTWLIWCLAELGDVASALRQGWNGIRSTEAGSATDASAHVLARLGMGCALLRKGDVKDAIQLLERCRDLRLPSQLDTLSPWVDSTLASAYLAADRVPDAITLATRAVDVAGSMKIMWGQPLRLACLGEAMLAEGRTEEARERALEALELSRRQKERGHEAYALRLIGDIMAHGMAGDLEAADASYREALTRASERGMRPLAASCHLALSRLHRRRNEPRLARAYLADAVAMYREMGMTPPLEPAEFQ